MYKTVAIVEDNLRYQQALIEVIESSGSFLLYQAYSSAEAAAAMLEEPPDIAIVDINLPGKNGIELIAQLSAASRVQCLVCSMYDDDEHIVTALKNGAVGYILKDSSAQQIGSALQELVNGGAPMSPFIATRVISFFRRPGCRDQRTVLSDRESQVLELIARGLQYKEVAESLSLSVETIKKHMKNIYHKLQVQNKMEAVNKYRWMSNPFAKPVLPPDTGCPTRSPRH